MKLNFTRFAARFPYGYFLQWNLVGINPVEESGDFHFKVERSGGSEGPWTSIFEGYDQYAIFDKFNSIESTEDELQPNQLRIFSEYYYKITCTTPSGKTLTDLEETGPKFPTRKMTQYWRKAKRDFLLSLKFNGTPMQLLKKRKWGKRCSICFDKKVKEVIRPNCPMCWGTGFIGGYWNPYETLVRRNGASNASTIGPIQTSDSVETNFWFPDFPLLEREDILISMADQRRFRVDQQLQTEILLTPVHQEAVCQELRHDHLIYKFPILPKIELAPVY